MATQVLVIGSKEDVQRLVAEHEKAELEAIRARLRISSIEDADQRMQHVELANQTTLQILQDAYASWDDDDLVDFETALERARRLETIEREYDRIGRAWYAQRKRVDYLTREAAKA